MLETKTEAWRTDADTSMAVADAAAAPAASTAAEAGGSVALSPAVHAAADATAITTSAKYVEATDPAQAHSAADVQPLPEQTTKPRPSSRFSSPLEQLAMVELQLCLQFLDSDSKLKAARCSRSLMQAADHPFAWQGTAVSVSSSSQPRLGSLIRQSLLRHAPIALTLDSDVPVAEVAVIPRTRLRELTIHHGYRYPAGLALQVLSLPTLQGLRTLRVFRRLLDSSVQLLPSLSALHTLEWQDADVSENRRWLVAMPALTDLELTGVSYLFPRSLIDAIGQCMRLRLPRLQCPRFEGGDSARLRLTRHAPAAPPHAQHFPGPSGGADR